jgi:hypothetical protein
MLAARPINLSRSTQRIIQRRTFLGISKTLDKRLYRMARGVMPTISQTEQVALGCGTIGFDRDIFSGSPSLQHLIDTYIQSFQKKNRPSWIMKSIHFVSF